MKNEIRVWRCEENQELVRVLENLQRLALGIKDNTEIDEYEAEEKHVETGFVQITTQKGKANVERQ
jgi:hypothetical protein